MIKKVLKIKNLGVFTDFSWDTHLSEFKRFNLIYGWNGCGKSTLAHLFSILNVGTSKKYPSVEYEIEVNDTKIKSTQSVQDIIRVFDQDYILNNIKLLEGKASSIYILGEENKVLAEQIEKDEKTLESRKTETQKLQAKKETLAKQRGKQFTAIASTISVSIGGNLSRTYRKPDAEKKFKLLEFKKVLSEDKLSECHLVLKQQQKESVLQIVIPTMRLDKTDVPIEEVINNILVKSGELLKKSIEIEIVERLKANPDISEWVEQGVAIHNLHKSEVCEYCQNIISEQRNTNLKNHFNKEDQGLKLELNNLLDQLRQIYTIVEAIQPIDKANLYTELQTSFQMATKDFRSTKKALLSEITLFADELKTKKKMTTEQMDLNKTIDFEKLNATIDSLNIVLKRQNANTEAFTTKKQEATEKIEMHYLSSIFDDIQKIDLETKEIDINLAKLQNGDKDEQDPVCLSTEELQLRIDNNKSTISSEHKACSQINTHLKRFLGRDELIFEVEKEGYAIKRNDQVAYNLSESEKTAIAFIYFIIHLRDQNFDITKGIVVVDDPISSLDSNSIFQAFSLLKNSVKNAHQVFILTHNFDFMRLIINWLKNAKVEERFLMINNRFVNTKRYANIEELDKLLLDHESEYHYLFKRLYMFKSDGTIESVYDIPNLARKVLDTFLMFMVPSSESQYKKMERIKFDENKKTSIYKFTNDKSHITGKGFDPSLVQETQTNVSLLLEMIKNVFPDHYSALEDSISVS